MCQFEKWDIGTRHIVDGFRINKTILKCLLIMKHLLINCLEPYKICIRLTTRPEFYDPHHCNFI